MAEYSLKLTRNVPGRFYVDETCIDCGLCPSTAPSIFTRDDLAGTSFVQRQPATPEEIAAAEDAVESCPTSSIGNDGEA